MEGMDEAIKSNVVEALSRDSRINPARILVDVNNAHVTLDGDAPTLFAIKAAMQLVLSVPGVRTISNRLHVKASQKRPTDADIQQWAQRILSWNASLDTARLQVTVSDGAITLRGWVDAYWKRGHAERLMLDLQGVVAVDNEVVVQPELAPDDRVIADDVKMAIARCFCGETDAIDVDVQQGQVTLSGRVSSLWSKYTTPHLADSILGVRGVTDKLVVVTNDH